MKMTSLKFAALALVLNVSLYAAEVLKVDANSTVWISSKNEKVQIQDQLCVYQATGLLGCGDVIALTADRFALKLYETKSASRAGEIVTLRKTKRSLATTEKLSGKFEDGSIGEWFEDALAVFDQVTSGPQIVIGSSMGGWMRASSLSLRIVRKGSARVVSTRQASGYSAFFQNWIS